jgi:transcriptional regulator with XRE-family HTH domain
MLGDTIREARIRKGLTQARLASLAGVSRRHLAALEKGANVSVSILQRVAAVLEVTEIDLGDLHVRAKDDGRGINMPLLTDAIREARTDAERAQATLARAESLLSARDAGTNVVALFPFTPVHLLEKTPKSAGAVREDAQDLEEIEVDGELRQGQPVDETKKEKVRLPKALFEQGEVVFRARSRELEEHGILDGDLVIAQPRLTGRAATGELVIARAGSNEVFVGRWWQKHGRKAVLTAGGEVTARGLKVVAVINQVVRGS